MSHVVVKSLLTTLIVLSIAAWATTATAYVVQIITSIPVASADNENQLKRALKTAIEDIVDHAIAFKPTIVTVRDARIVKDRIYILLLLADRDGEETIGNLLDPDAKER